MKNNSILLLTKDAMCTDYLPCYGNQYWKGKTPNLDELVSKGTLFTRYYTAAPSSNMSYLAMSTGKYCHELDIATYVHLTKDYEGTTMFDRARERGYTCHILWDDAWTPDIAYCRCYGERTVFHPIKGLRQGVGSHYKHEGFLVPDDTKVETSLRMLRQEMDVISNTDERVFLWIHLPHVINGRVSFGGDIDVFDDIIGMMREYFSDERIYISADHGNMNGHGGVLGYGFDGREAEIRIPLITPRKQGLAVCDALMSNIDTDALLFSDEIPEREYIFSDTAYYAQEHRILNIIKGRYKYVFHKADGREELFDLFWDPNEQFSLMSDMHYDKARKESYPSSEHYFYDRWDELPSVREEFRALRASMWREPALHEKASRKARSLGGKIYRKIRKAIHR